MNKINPLIKNNALMLLYSSICKTCMSESLVFRLLTFRLSLNIAIAPILCKNIFSVNKVSIWSLLILLFNSNWLMKK